MSQDAGRSGGSPPRLGGRLRSIAMIAVFDVGGPLVAYSVLRSAGLTSVTALVVSGVFPALGVAIRFIQHHRLDVIGILVLAGIVVGAVLGLATRSPKLVLVEGSVPTAMFGLACLGSLRARRPLMLTFALEFTGPETAKGREMAGLWQYAGFRHAFRVITLVWGVGFLVEAAVRVVIVQNTSTGTALASSKAMPFLWAAILATWTAAYGTRQKRKGQPVAPAATTETPAIPPGGQPPTA